MFIEQVSTGGDRNFGYLVADDETRKAIVIDLSREVCSISSSTRPTSTATA